MLQVLSTLLPVALLLLAGLRRNRDRCASDRIPEERWTFGDTFFIAVLVAAIQQIPRVALGHSRPLATLLLYQFGGAFLILAALEALLRFRHHASLATVAFRGGHSSYYVVRCLRVVSGLLALSAGAVTVAYLFLGGEPLSTRVMIPGRTVMGTALDGLIHRSLTGQAVLVLELLNVIVLGPFTEELIFRGLFYPPLARKWGFAGSVFLTAMIWASTHAYRPGRMAFSFAAGILYGYLYARTRSIIPSLVFHIAGNSLVAAVHLGRQLERPMALLFWAAIAGGASYLALRQMTRLLERGAGTPALQEKS